ncbi:hypothetical protein J2X45_003842, partial [Caulobacter sp. BE264]|uniref:DUF6538 domain-containing protein n=1 Tax=Caulobacter sp. BE264 TaxID=2817724 RepID=UPI00285997BC
MRVIGLKKRGGTFVVRFRIPAELRSRLGMTEFHRSLHTRDPQEAERLGLQAAAWFWRQMESIGRMETATRSDLEQAAKWYFEQLLRGHPSLPVIPLSNPVEREERRAELRADLAVLRKFIAETAFSPTINGAARDMLLHQGIELDQLDDDDKRAAIKLAARALAEETRVLLRQLGAPASDPDTFFEAPGFSASIKGIPSNSATDSRSKTLGAAVAEHLAAKRTKGVSPNTIAEAGRVLAWLSEDVGAETALTAVGKPRMRQFRDDIQRLRAGLQGQAQTFQQRLTDDPAGRIKSATAIKYWNSVLGFFSWCTAELDLTPNPCAGLLIERAKGEKARTPEPFSDAEFQAYLQTPLFQGRKSINRPNLPGSLKVRDGKWWLFVLLMHTGMRPGEVSCQTALKVDPLSASKIDPSGLSSRAGGEARSG